MLLQHYNMEQNDIESKLSVVKSIGDIVGEEDFIRKLKSGKQLIAYNGFEPSGQMTFAQCMMAVINVNKLTSIGFKFIFLVADVFAQLNNKLSGDRYKIVRAGKLMEEIWIAAGMNMTNVEFKWAANEILGGSLSDVYWSRVMDIMSKFTITRLLKGTPALGREESVDLPASTLLYAAMQCADIFYLDIDLIQMGTDQLKVNMLAREYCDKEKIRNKPVIVSHELIGGLDGGEKMSKSNPATAIFMTDSVGEVERKVRKAFCEPGNPTGPLFDLIKYILIPLGGITITWKHNDGIAFRVYNNYEVLCSEFETGTIHPSDLKPAVAQKINEILAPVREKFTENRLMSLLNEVKGYKITK